jgi:hypothetical protein
VNTDSFGTIEEQAIPVRAHGTVVKRLGHWTQGSRFDVRASRGSVVLDLRSPQIGALEAGDPQAGDPEAGEIEVWLDIDRAVVKLLVPSGVVIDHGDTRRIGRCRVKDWTGVSAPGGRRIVLTGEMRSSEVRVHRGGVAILSAMCSREYVADAWQARRDGRYPTIDDPSR